MPQNGSVTVVGNDIQYSPNSSFIGIDRFNYNICDDGVPSLCDIATVNIIVFPVNDTLCANPLTIPTLLSNGDVCSTENIYLFTQENYPPVCIGNSRY